MMKSNSLTNRILAFALTLVMILGMLPSGFVSVDAVSAGLMVYIDPLDEWIEKGYTLKVWSGSDVRIPTDDNGDGIYNFQLPSGWTTFELVVADDESGYDYIYYTNDMEIPTDDRNLYTAESVVMADEVLGEITGTWSVYVPQSYTTVYFKPLQEWIDAGYRFNFSETVNADLQFFTDDNGDGIYEVALDSELVDQWREGRYLHIQVREAGEDRWFSYKYYAQVIMPNDGSNLFTATALDEKYQREIIGTWSVYTPGQIEPEPEPEPEPEVTYVAEVNGTPYETLKDAILAVRNEGGTLKMLTDASIGYVGVMVYNDFVWDMNGKTLTVESEMTLGGDATITVTGNGTINNLRLLTNVIVENGTYAQITVPTGKNLLFKDGTVSGTMTVQGTATIAGGTVRGIIGTGSALITGGTVTNTFTLADFTGAVSITGGSFNRDVSEYVAEGYECVYENGSYVVRLKEKSYAAEVNGTKYETLEAALSAAQSGDALTLLSDVTAAGPITIAKDITLNLNGFTLTLPDHNNYAIVVKDSLTINGEGNVIVEGLYGIGLSTTCTGGLTVNGGNITGANADYLIGAFNGKVTINGGNLTANYCVVNSFDGYNATAEIEGGTLTAEYPVLGTDIVVSDDTMLNVGGFLCRNGENYYIDLATAIADAASGSTIVLLADGEGPGAVIDKKIEINFNKHTYLFTEGVGSKGTESNGFQILAGAYLTLRNGKLGVAESAKNQFYILLQNYGQLDAYYMTLDGTNLDKWSATDGDSYVLSVNSGDVNFGFGTIIANDEGDKAYAFDVCDYPGYEGAPSVDVTGDSQIYGKVDLTAFGESSLTIFDSYFYDEVDISKLTDKSDFVIVSGTYVNDISAYVLEGRTAVYEDGKYIVRLNQTGFGFLKNNETIPFTEGLTYTNAVVGGEVDGTVTYTVIEGKDIATVDKNGVLTITGVGTIVVRAEKTGNDDYAPAYAAYTLTVTKGASSITTEKTHVDLVFGVDSYQMPIETVGDGVVSYTISDTDVAVTLNPVTGELTFDDTVDKVGSFTVTISMAEGDNYSAAEDVSYTVTLSYAETSDVLFTLSPAAPNAKGWYNESVYLAPAEGYQFCLQVDGTVSEWRSNGIEYTDGVYENVVIYLKDAAGNITAPVEVGTLKIDSVKPDVAMEIANAVWKTISEKIFFITNKDVTVKVTVSDATSDIEEVQISIDSGETFSSLGNHAGEYLVTLKAEHRDAIEVKVVDKAGMENAAKSEGIIVVDQEKPGIQAEFTGVDATSKDVIFTDGEDFSVKYTVDENNLDLHDKTLSVTINGTEEIWTLSDVGVVEKTLTGEGVYRMIATFIDVANNTPATDTKDYVIDSAAPTITLAQDGLTEINNIYYTDSNSYGLDITVDESLYEVYLAHGVKPAVTVNGEKVDLDWSKPNAKLNLFDEDVYEIVVTYDNLVYDAVTETITIVVDYNEPVITLIPEIDVVESGVYYTAKENYGLKITLTEELYDYYYGLGFKPEVTVNGEAVELDWSKPETVLTLAKNGVYEIEVNYENYLNKAVTENITIVVDHEKPVITLTPEIDLVQNNVYYTAKENYGLKISLTDDLYDHNLACGIEPVVTVNGKEEKLDWTKPETVLTLAENGVYEIEVNYENYLSKAETKTITIVVDHEEPVITLTPEIELIENGVYYTAKENYGLTISLNEDLYDHYLACGIEPVVTVNGKEEKLDWTKPETVLTLAENGVYEITVNYANYLHTAEEKTITIVVDHEVPVIELIHGIEDPDLLVDGTYYTDDENYKLTIHLTEDLYDYYLTCGIAPVVTVNGAETTLTWNHMDDEAVLEAILPLTEDGVYAIAVNYANYLHTAEEKTITICRDTVDPEVTITYRDAEGKDIVSEIVNHVGETVFADAVTAVITVKDVNFDQNSVALTVTPANAVAQTRTYTAAWNEVSEGVWECLLVLDVAADYVIEFNCQDYANNANSASAKLAVDIDEVPDNFKFAYSTSVRGEILENLTLGFWRNQLTVTVDVVDDISGVAFFTASYSVAEDAYKNGNVAGAFECDELKVLVSEEITNGYRVTFLVPKEMLTKDNQVNGYITLTATDYADNSTTVTDGVRMIVDNIDPTRTVELTAPVNQTETVKYYNGNIVLRANIFEANYRFYDDAVVSIVKDGKAYGLAGHVSGWLKGDANAINTITLNEDGDYVVTITYTDGSGNKMADYSSGKMTLDTIAPVITVNNIKQNSANKDETYGFTITVSDINLDAETVQPKLTAVVKGEDGLYSTKEIELGDAKLSADGTTVTYTVENLDEDALYTLTCSAEDMSNNLCNVIQLDDGKTYETVNFSINRNGSTFGFGTEYMTELVNQYYVYSVYEDLVIVEVNVDPIENYIVTVNGEELVEGTHFTTEQTSNPGEWSIRTYTIDKSYFAEEGEYNVIVTSTDKAETTAYSDIKNLAIAFVVDQTAPVLTISGLQTGGRYQTEEQTVTLIPTDEGGRLNTLKVVVMDSDGNPLTDDAGNDISVRFDYSGEDLLNYLSENGDMVTFTIPTGLEHQVQISCTDCAVDEHGIANEYNGVFSRVTVSKNALVIFYANKSVFYGTLGGLAALIILIVVLLKKKKEKK